MVASTSRSIAAFGLFISPAPWEFHSSILERTISLSSTITSVKGKRGYDATRRRDQARKRQDRIVKVAERRFLRDGYEPTTIAAVAQHAGVSVDTIYKSFGGKPGLIRAICARALMGAGPIPAEERSDQLQAREADPRKIIRGWGVFVTEIMPLTAPILLLVRNAASARPELRALLKELDADRLRRMTENARRLAAAGHLRVGITVSDAADVLWTYSSPELYELLVLRREMPLKAFGQFVASAMIAALLNSRHRPFAAGGLSGSGRTSPARVRRQS